MNFTFDSNPFGFSSASTRVLKGGIANRWTANTDAEGFILSASEQSHDSPGVHYKWFISIWTEKCIAAGWKHRVLVSEKGYCDETLGRAPGVMKRPNGRFMEYEILNGVTGNATLKKVEELHGNFLANKAKDYIDRAAAFYKMA